MNEMEVEFLKIIGAVIVLTIILTFPIMKLIEWKVRRELKKEKLLKEAL